MTNKIRLCVFVIVVAATSHRSLVRSVGCSCSIQKEAGKDELMTIKLDMWNVVLKGRIEDLLTALESWVATKDSAHKQLTTAFLNPQTARPFVDLYELGLRLRHILRRLAILASALSSNTPSRLVTSSPSAPQTALSSVFIGGAVAANSFHVLRSLSITHFLNATEDLFLPGTPTAEYISREFQVLRIPLRDDEDEDIEPYFFTAGAFIENAVNDGGRCLVHCHAGQSRSCALVIAWLLLYKSFNLRDAIRLVQRWAVDLVPRALARPDSLTRSLAHSRYVRRSFARSRPSAAPNAGYMRALGRLEERTCGSKSHVDKLKKKKPDALHCPVCGDVVGISKRTLDFHMMRKHHNSV